MVKIGFGAEKVIADMSFTSKKANYINQFYQVKI